MIFERKTRLVCGEFIGRMPLTRNVRRYLVRSLFVVSLSSARAERENRRIRSRLPVALRMSSVSTLIAGRVFPTVQSRKQQSSLRPEARVVVPREDFDQPTHRFLESHRSNRLLQPG